MKQLIKYCTGVMVRAIGKVQCSGVGITYSTKYFYFIFMFASG